MSEPYKKTFVVDRGTWRFGGDKYNSARGYTALMNEKGLRCCLGFVASQLGVSDDRLIEAGIPEELRDNCGLMGVCELPPLTVDKYRTGSVSDTELSAKAMAINDDDLTHQQREQQLTELFNSHGYGLTFEGAYPEDVA